MRVVGYCGIVCSDCPILIVTRREDDAARKRVAEMLTRHYGREYKPESINCDGCLSSTNLWDDCRTCEVRKCARERKVENCVSCPDYRCERLSKLRVRALKWESLVRKEKFLGCDKTRIRLVRFLLRVQETKLI